jgi:hypothetical protein
VLSTALTLHQNAFSQVLFKFGFDCFKMLAVDLLHEFELGVWKDFLIHIIRILEFLGMDKVQIFDERCVTQMSCCLSVYPDSCPHQLPTSSGVW